MSWQDDLETRLQQSIQNVGNDINAYIQARVVDPVVKIGQPAQGNLSAAQIAAGQRGQNPDASIEKDIGSPSDINGNGSMMKWVVPVVAISVVAYFLLGKKRG